jgi:hypothetical protein
MRLTIERSEYENGINAGTGSSNQKYINPQITPATVIKMVVMSRINFWRRCSSLSSGFIPILLITDNIFFHRFNFIMLPSISDLYNNL